MPASKQYSMPASESHSSGYLAITISSIVICCSLAYVPIMLQQVNTIQLELAMGMEEFKLLQGTLWSDLIKEKKADSLFIHRDSHLSVTKRSIKQTGGTCDCINNNICPPGPPGPPGIDGKDGDNGKTGEAGPTGNVGPPMESLPKESSCRVCPPGSTGQPGYLGQPGPPGSPGTHGPKGTPGRPGAMGPQGGSGEKGPAGRPGKDGQPGTKGQEGVHYSPGPRGQAGARGPLGTKGYPGTPGNPGQPGLQGPKGTPGESGHEGPPGWPGMPGGFGENGTPGQDASYCKCPERQSSYRPVDNNKGETVEDKPYEASLKDAILSAGVGGLSPENYAPAQEKEETATDHKTIPGTYISIKKS